ncbi:MAG: SRPBCC domain-containing protein [Bacteroidales bacterium]|jgi:uncharacterized protein YndB with AHSA1/START domain|nr:SRPBCC domain-containing protein [Bacteroidales bacterium]
MDEPIVVKQEFGVGTDQLWSAVTEPDIMRKWFFDNIPDFKAEIGFKTNFNVVSESRNFMHLWCVTDVVPNARIVYNWEYDGYYGRAYVVFTISGNDTSSALEVSFHVTEPFDQSIPEFRSESCLGGWQYFINGKLKEFLKS